MLARELDTATHLDSLLAFSVERNARSVVLYVYKNTVFVGVYIPPSAHANYALAELYGALNELQCHIQFVAAGDFSHAYL